MTWQFKLIAWLVVMLSILFFAPRAETHGHYDRACCSGIDCRPLVKGEFKLVGKQWYLRNVQRGKNCGWERLKGGTKWDGKGTVRISPDFSVHGCFIAAGTGCKPLCIYLGGGV